ncbi:hypothetical protein Tco_0004969 [Tanacetum coccineum]
MALYIHFPKAGWLNPIFGVLFWEKEIEEDSFMVLKLDKKVIEYKIRYDLRILGPEHEGLHVVTYKSTTLLVLMKVVVAPTIETSSHLPECAHALGGSTSCCSYYPKATESLRLMLKYCDTYTSVYWKNLGESQAYNTPPEYGIRIDFDIPVTTRCLQCQDGSKGGGTCGYDVETHDFSCLCDKGNVTTYCKDHTQHQRSSRVVAGTATAVSVAGAIGIGVGVWYFRKVRAKAPVTHPDVNMAFDLRPTKDVLPWPGGANIAFDLVPNLQCLLRTWCEYGIRLSIGLATPLTYVLYLEILTWHARR